jgi:hypothetical protein
MKQSIMRILAVGLVLGALLGSAIPTASARNCLDCKCTYINDCKRDGFQMAGDNLQISKSSYDQALIIIFGVINDGGGLTNRGPVPPWTPRLTRVKTIASL